MAVRLEMKSGVKGAIKGVARSEGGDFFFFGVSFFFLVGKGVLRNL